MRVKRLPPAVLGAICWINAIIAAGSLGLGLALLAVTYGKQAADLSRVDALRVLSRHLPLLVSAEMIKLAQAALMVFFLPSAAAHLQGVARWAANGLGWSSVCFLALSSLSGLMATIYPLHAAALAAFAIAFGMAYVGANAGWLIIFGAKLVACHIAKLGCATIVLGLVAATALMRPSLMVVVGGGSILWWFTLGAAIGRDLEGVRSAI